MTKPIFPHEIQSFLGETPRFEVVYHLYSLAPATACASRCASSEGETGCTRSPPVEVAPTG